MRALLPALLLALLCILCTAPASAATASAATASPSDKHAGIQTLDDANGVEDPRRLLAAADSWRDQGDVDLARDLYGLALDRAELSRYLHPRPMLRQALILERLGRLDEAADQYRAGFADDIQTTLQVLRIASVHPDRDALVAEGIAEIRDRVARAKAGQRVPIYTTKKGEPRYLTVIPDDRVIDELRAGGGRLKYCYIDHLDLSKAAAPELPDLVILSRCIIGQVSIPDRDLGTLVLRSIVLGDVDIGKTWEGAVNRSRTIPASRVNEIAFRDGIFLGHVNLQDVHVSGRNALFALAVFEGQADFRDTVFAGTSDFRFSVFGQGANFKGAHMTDAVYFGHSRYLRPVTFRGMFSEQDVFFNSAEFDDAANFDRCEWVRGATFENSIFHGPVSFNASRLGERLNMSRAVFDDTLSMKEMQLRGMDLLGTWLQGDASFQDVQFDGKVRFALDDITRRQNLEHPDRLLSLYRDYQGDKDAQAPLTTRSSYGVGQVDDLTARIDGNISFANSIFTGFTIFRGVTFGRPGGDTSAEFYNTQFKGESHFERTNWNSKADFTTIFANELSFLEATFQDTLILDDANIAGRAVLTDATFSPGATLSLYGSEIASLQIARDQVVETSGWSWLWQASETHRLFYQQCAQGHFDPTDPRIQRIQREGTLSDTEIRQICTDRLVDEYVSLKQSFGDRAMTSDEDWAYWWIRHTETVASRTFGGALGVAAWAIKWPLFELAFGWGVHLGNLAWTSLAICWLFAMIYRVFCPDSVMAYNGADVPVREISFWGLFYISLQSFGAFNTGWDFGKDDGRLQYINTVQTFIGVIVLTFFVGAYTRMILA
ncbi:MAG: hypothetical protein GXP62_05465 [Oligoflexia bacterium]|nr:hypothetical protein [Oligoflexia bacterium]